MDDNKKPIVFEPLRINNQCWHGWSAYHGECSQSHFTV